MHSDSDTVTLHNTSLLATVNNIIIVIIRPHCRTMYINMAYCYRQSSMVCRSVTTGSPTKMAEPIEIQDAVWVVDLDGPKEARIAWGPDPHAKGQF